MKVRLVIIHSGREPSLNFYISWRAHLLNIGYGFQMSANKIDVRPSASISTLIYSWFQQSTEKKL